jgi:hypothetical protein
VRAARERYEMNEREARRIGTDMRKDLEHTEKTDGERLWGMLGLYADKVGGELGRGRWR